MKQRTFYFVASIFFLMTSCSGGAKPHDQQQTVDERSKTTSAEKQEQPKETHPGEAVYQSYCITCHQVDGSGVPGMYPPLWDEKWIGSKDTLIHIALNGQSGEIEVDGEIYSNLMPPHNHLSDQEIANVLSYIRVSFGNDFEPVKKEEVAAARDEK